MDEILIRGIAAKKEQTALNMDTDGLILAADSFCEFYALHILLFYYFILQAANFKDIFYVPYNPCFIHMKSLVIKGWGVLTGFDVVNSYS